MPVLLRAFSDITSQTQTVQLGGTSYRVRLIWRERCFAWYFSIAALDGTEILNSVRLEPGQAVTRRADPALLPGVVVTAQAGILGDRGTKSDVWLVFRTAGPGTSFIAAGSVVTDGTTEWVTTERATKPVGVTWSYPVLARAADEGAIGAAAGTITTLITTTTTVGGNITAVTNPAAATPGTDPVEVVQADLASDLLLVFYEADEIPEATADTDTPTITIP